MSTYAICNGRGLLPISRDIGCFTFTSPFPSLPISASCGRLLRWLLSVSFTYRSYYYAPAPRVEALSDDARLTSICLTSVSLSVAYIGPKSRTERPRQIKIGTEVAQVTCDSDTTIKVKRSKVSLQGRGHIVAASRTACSFRVKCSRWKIQ